MSGQRTARMFYQHSNANIKNHHDIYYYENLHFAKHMHHDYELVTLLSGELEIWLDTRSFVMKAPGCALVLSDQMHAYRCIAPSASVVHVFSGDVVADLHQKLAGQTGISPVFFCSDSVRDFYLDTLTVRRDFGDYTLKGCLYLIMEEYLRSVTLQPRKTTQTDLLASIFAYVSAHYTEPITLDDVAKECGYNAHYLSRIFSAAVGIHFRRFVNSYRLDHARTLLQQEGVSVTEAALASGFGSVRSFNRAFAEEYSHTPREHTFRDEYEEDRVRICMYDSLKKRE